MSTVWRALNVRLTLEETLEIRLGEHRLGDLLARARCTVLRTHGRRPLLHVRKTMTSTTLR